jgi:hypothetical protein
MQHNNGYSGFGRNYKNLQYSIWEEYMKDNWTFDNVKDRLNDFQFDMSHRVGLRYIDMGVQNLKSFISWIAINGVAEMECSQDRITMIYQATLKGDTYKLIVGPHLRDSKKVFVIGLFKVRKAM